MQMGRTSSVVLGPRRKGLVLAHGTGGGSLSNLLPVSADAFWIRTPSPWGTALAYRIERNNFTDASSLGSPSQCWRLIRLLEIATVDTNPSSVLFTFSAGTGGANDYAFQRSTGDTQFGGSFHGGETATSMVLLGDGAVLDHTLAASFSTFKIARTGGQGRQSTITWDDAQAMSAEFLLTINSDGTLSDAGSFTSTAPFSTQYVGMLALETTFTQRINSAGTVSTATDSDMTGDASDLTYRAGATGHTVRIQSNIPSATRYSKTRTDNQSTQIKHYPELASTAGVAFGTVSYSRTITLAKGEPDPPPPPGITWVAADGQTASWANTTEGVQNDAFDGTGLVFGPTLASGQQERWILAVPSHVAGKSYTVDVEWEATENGSPHAHGGGNFSVINTSNGAGSPNVLASGLINSFTFPATYVASQAIHYMSFTQQNGPAGRIFRVKRVTVTEIP